MRKFIFRLSDYMAVAAGVVLVFMACLTFADILMRYFWTPIPGVYEIVGFLGVALAALVLPRSFLMRAHVAVDLVVEKLSDRIRMYINIIIRLLLAIVFLITAWYLVGMAQSFVETNSVTMTLKIPFYPVVYIMVFSFLVQTVAFIYQIFEKEKGVHNE